MRRFLAIATLSSSLVGLAACSAGSSSAIPSTSAQSGVKGGLAKFSDDSSNVGIESGVKGGLNKFSGVKGGLNKFSGVKGGLSKF